MFKPAWCALVAWWVSLEVSTLLPCYDGAATEGVGAVVSFSFKATCFENLVLINGRDMLFVSCRQLKLNSTLGMRYGRCCSMCPSASLAT